MFYELDQAIETLLQDPSAPLPLRNAVIDFETPAKGYAPGNDTVNVFLIEIKENRVLRDPQPIIEMQGGLTTRRMPPMRVDVTYMVTAWPTTNTAPLIQTEHDLLAQAAGWLNNFSILPPALVPNQPFPVMMFTALPDERLSISEFWSALGIAPKAAFTLTATVALDYRLPAPNGPQVTTILTEYRQDHDPGTNEERIIIGGYVLDPAGQPVMGAWVHLEPLGWTQFTNANGQFIFTDVPEGRGYTLRARKTGISGEARLPNFEVPSLNGHYDIHF